MKAKYCQRKIKGEESRNEKELGNDTEEKGRARQQKASRKNKIHEARAQEGESNRYIKNKKEGEKVGNKDTARRKQKEATR